MSIYFPQTFSNNGNEDLKTAKIEQKLVSPRGPKSIYLELSPNKVNEAKTLACYTTFSINFVT